MTRPETRIPIMKRSLLLVELLIGAATCGLAMVLLAAASPLPSAHDLVVPVGTAGCYRSTLLQQVLWTTSGLWTSGAEGDSGVDGDRLLLADVHSRSIVTFDAGGRFLGTLGGVNGNALSKLGPLLLRENASNHERMVEIEGDGNFDRMVSLDKSFAPRARYLVETTQSGAQGRVSAPFQWEPVGNDIVAFTDLEKSQKRNPWQSAIVRYPISDPEHFTVLQDIGLHDPERTFYRLGYQYITSLGNTAYLLTMGTEPGIVKDTDADGKKSSTLFSVRRSLSSTSRPELNPQLPEFWKLRDYGDVMAAAEHAAMPTGIYGWNGYLYVLSRIPDGGGTIWVLRKFSPQGELVGAVRIPAQANHLTPVPGPHFWAFVEKGPVKDYVVQDIKTILFVPSDLLQASPAAPVDGDLTVAPSVCK
jgi:hypothetical protein